MVSLDHQYYSFNIDFSHIPAILEATRLAAFSKVISSDLEEVANDLEGTLLLKDEIVFLNIVIVMLLLFRYIIEMEQQ